MKANLSTAKRYYYHNEKVKKINWFGFHGNSPSINLCLVNRWPGRLLKQMRTRETVDQSIDLNQDNRYPWDVICEKFNQVSQQSIKLLPICPWITESINYGNCQWLLRLPASRNNLWLIDSVEAIKQAFSLKIERQSSKTQDIRVFISPFGSRIQNRYCLNWIHESLLSLVERIQMTVMIDLL